MHTIKWFQVLLYNSHNLTSVICFLTVCSILPIDRTLPEAPRVRVNMGAMAMIGYSPFPNDPRLKPLIRLFRTISRTHIGCANLTTHSCCQFFYTALTDWPYDVEVNIRTRLCKKRVWTLVVQLWSLSDRYLWEGYESPYSPGMHLIVTLLVFYSYGFWIK